MRKRIAWLTVFAALFCLLASCGQKTDTGEPSGTYTQEQPTPDTGKSPDVTGEENDPSDPSTPTPQPTVFKLNSSTPGIRVLGERYLASDSQINCDWTCSGIELTVNNSGDSIRFSISSDAGCYFRAYIDGKAWMLSDSNPYYIVTGTSGVVTLKNVPAGVHTVRLIKVTGYTLARAEITSVMLTGEILTTAPEQNDLYIEFVGDSITCGWGTIGGHAGSYADQDGTLAYPYLLAQALHADYSMTALSGQGLLCGNPGVTNGYLYASPTRDSSTAYDFSRKANLVVINIGTNDFNNAQVTQQAFQDAYRAFLNTVREKNGETCKILCLYNAMNDTYSSAILSVAEELGGANAGIWTYSLQRADGNNHPSISEHQAYAETLEPLIKRVLNSTGFGLTLVPEGDGDADFYELQK